MFFSRLEGAAVDGTQRGSLVEAIPSGDVLHEIRELSHRVYYNHRGILVKWSWLGTR